MNEIDHNLEELRELEIEALKADKRHSGIIKEAAGCSALVFTAFLLSVFSDAPPLLDASLAVVGLIGSASAFLESETTLAEREEAKRKVEDYEKRQFISRLKS